jgi:hypothetical protein
MPDDRKKFAGKSKIILRWFIPFARRQNSDRLFAEEFVRKVHGGLILLKRVATSLSILIDVESTEAGRL